MALLDQITTDLHALAMKVRDHRRKQERRDMVSYWLLLGVALAEQDDMLVSIEWKEAA